MACEPWNHTSVLGVSVCRGNGITTATGSAAVGDVGAAAMGGTVACGSAYNVGKCRAYTTACLEVNLTFCSTKIEPFLGQ